MIPNFLKQRSFLTPNRIAVKYKEMVMTFKELDYEATMLARKLTTAGVKKQDVVAVLMKNSLEMVVLLHALKYLGAITVLLNAKLTVKELAWQLNNSQSTFMITTHEFMTVKEQIEVMTKNTTCLMMKDIQTLQEESFQQIAELSLDVTDTVMYTSGTTGFPKGVMQTYGNHWWSSVGSVLNLGLSEKDCWLIAVPLFHISGLSILMRSVIYGIPVIIHDQFDAKHANHAIINEGVTIVSVVSAMLTRMIQDLNGEHYPNHFRCMLLGGGPAPKPLLEECKELSIPVFQTYGMTETSSQIVTLAPEDSLAKLGSAGKPLFPAQIRIEKDGHTVAAMIPGEIVVKGPNVTSGYLHNEEATNKAIVDGWLYTGDLGYLDEEGFLFVLDRRSDLIISGGENVYPAEIEAALLRHPKISEAGVTGITDERWGQVPCAFIVLNEGENMTTVEVTDFCLTCLAKYKVPKEVYFVKELPRNASNKLVRRKLMNLVGGKNEN